MDRRLAVALLAGIAMLSLSGTAKAQINDNWTFGLIPADGAIAGPPGSTIGWGYTLANQSTTYWLFAFAVSTDTAFINATASAAPFDFPLLAPGASTSVPYDGFVGLTELTWGSTALDGFVNSGNFILNAGWYDDDPFAGGNLVGDAGTRSAAYRAVAVAPAASDVPEPGTCALLVLGSLPVVGALARPRR